MAYWHCEKINLLACLLDYTEALLITPWSCVWFPPQGPLFHYANADKKRPIYRKVKQSIISDSSTLNKCLYHTWLVHCRSPLSACQRCTGCRLCWGAAIGPGDCRARELRGCFPGHRGHSTASVCGSGTFSGLHVRITPGCPNTWKKQTAGDVRSFKQFVMTYTHQTDINYVF